MELKRMKGDRNIKDNDKHLFLETILSAQQYLYMSYLGQSAKDNTNMPPSALLDELIDYIETGCAESDGVRKAIINRHPLHNFSRKYNSGDSDFYNYLDSNTVLIKQETSVKPLSTLLFDELSLSQFIGFFKHPFKEYYNKVLSIYYEDESVLLSDTELFDLDKLQEWNLKHTLLTVTKEEVPAVKSRLVKTGALPLKHMADISIATIDEEVEKVRDLFQVCVNGADSRILNLSAKLDTTLLKGAVSNVYDDKLVYVSYSKNEYKYLLDAYMTYLAATACGEILTVHFISATRQQTYTGVAIQQQEACDRLMGLLSLYKQGHESILAFHPLLKIDPADVSLLDKDKFGKMLKKVFENFMVPCEDRYLLNEYANQYFHSEDVVDRFKENCEKLVTPLAEIFPDYFN